MGPSWVVERAAEELRALEAQHPGRFGRLKLELRAFLSESGAGSCPHMPSTGSSWVAERAVEELRALEAEHPHGLGRLKLELRAFISDSIRPFPSLHPSEASLPRCLPLPSICSAATQESSNRKRKKGAEVHRDAAGEETGRKLREARTMAAKDSADLALERAEECLRKIRRVKEMLANGC